MNTGTKYSTSKTLVQLHSFVSSGSIIPSIINIFANKSIQNCNTHNALLEILKDICPLTFQDYSLNNFVIVNYSK